MSTVRIRESVLDRVVCTMLQRTVYSFQMCLESGDGSETLHKWRHESSRQLVPADKSSN